MTVTKTRQDKDGLKKNGKFVLFIRRFGKKIVFELISEVIYRFRNFNCCR